MPDVQIWADPAPGDTGLHLRRLHLEVDDTGHVRIHEALAAQLLTDAGWERTA